MYYQDLIESAGKIPAAEKFTISEYHKNMEALISAINTYMTDRKDLPELVGKNNIQMMKTNHLNHVLFVYSILQHPNPEVLVDTILWVFKTYRSHGFSVKYWEVQITAWLHILKSQLSHKANKQIMPLYIWIQEHISKFEKMSSLSTERANEL